MNRQRVTGKNKAGTTRMTEAELLYLLDLGEDQEIEFKSAKADCLNLSGKRFLHLPIPRALSGFRRAGKHGQWHIAGIKNPEAQRKAFWDCHNDAKKLSTPLCHEDDVQILTVQISNCY